MDMTTDHPQAVAVKATLDALINGVSGHGLEVLDKTYHRDMQIYMMQGSETLVRNDKPGFMAYIATVMGDAAGEHNVWARYHLVEANDEEAHILISRKNTLTGKEEIITLSIDFVFEDGRWQIIREVILTPSQE
ncbi:hypothetical protein KO498_04345 [Lentibacter algarum]|uniref:hypothetical protein n=1 Tax=Lentibacter algarum TaxID=576131 RepID=UPI001C07B3D5|nr:hypothetical protein [Lentibacter algarum]MBU2981038.1 hypothetical protein [Lentibacter algarum]